MFTSKGGVSNGGERRGEGMMEVYNLIWPKFDIKLASITSKGYTLEGDGDRKGLVGIFELVFLPA